LLRPCARVDSLAVEHLPRAHGRSNYTLRRLVRLWLNMFVNFSVMPLRLSTFTGIGLSILGLVGAIWAAASALFFEKTPPGWASLTVAVMLLSGVQLLILGLLGEYLGRVYLTVNRRPQTIVRTVTRSEAAESSQRRTAGGVIRGV